MLQDITEQIISSNKRSPYLFAAKRIYARLYPTPPTRIVLTISNYQPQDPTHPRSFRIQTHLANGDDLSNESAYFSINGNYIRAPFELLGRMTTHMSPPSMNIDCSIYRGQGISRMLILITLHYARIEYPRFNDESELFIDTDASDIVGHDDAGMGVSYWTAIGMVDNEASPSNLVSTGYEKRCSVKGLHSYLFRESILA